MSIRNWDSALGYSGPGSLFWKRRAWTHGRNNWLILGGLTYLLGMVEAYVDAHLQTFDVEPVAAATPDAVIVGLSIPLEPTTRTRR